MCQPKDKGGKRCAAHMSGSMATVSMASTMSGIKESFVRSVFSALNKEGKHLPQPSEEEIVAFARNNQFISRHDVTIPDNKRAMLVKRWQKAEMETPSGGTFHAWKHTLVESVVRWRRSFAAVGLAGAVAFTSACSGGATVPDNSSSAPTNSPTSISQTATPSASPSASVDPNLGAPAPAGDVVKTKYGSYLRTTISNDDPAMKVNNAIVDPSASGKYSPADITAAQQTVSKFIAEEAIDSPVNGGGESVDDWWAKNNSRIAPEYKAELLPNMKSGDAFVMNEKWQQEKYAGKYQYIYSETEPRVYNRKITPNAITLAGDNTSLAITSDVSYNMKAKPNVGEGKTGTQISVGTMAFAVRKDTASGKWLITGFSHNMNTTEG